MSTPLFSIIVPSYDRPLLLKEALRSVAAQTHEDFECIVVDDCGPTPAEVPDDPRFRLIRLSSNSGASQARNAGIEAARGHYLTFLDDDDRYTRDRLASVLKPHSDAPIVVGGAVYAGSGLAGLNRPLEGDVREKILTGMTPHLGATSIRRDLVPHFDSRYEASEDVEWWLRLSHAGRVAAIGRNVYLISRHQGTRNRNGPATRIRYTLGMLEHHKHYFMANPSARSFRLLRASITSRRIGDYELARDLALQSFRAKPSAQAIYHAARALHRSTFRVDRELPFDLSNVTEQPPVRLPLLLEDCQDWKKNVSGGFESRITPLRLTDQVVIALAHRLPLPWRGYFLAAGLRLLRHKEVPLCTPWARFNAPRDDHALLHPYFDEPLETAVISRCISEGAGVIDVGANRGWFTLLAAALSGPRGRVLCFEPDPRAREQLERSLDCNPDLSARITVRRIALAERAGEARFREHPQPSLSHLLSDSDDNSPGKVVTLGKLDAEVADAAMHRVDVIKIDVEGAEARVVRGAHRTLLEQRPILLVEAEPNHLRRFQQSPKDIVAEIPDEYEIFWVSWSPSGLRPFKDGPPPSGRNLLAIPSERACKALQPLIDGRP